MKEREISLLELLVEMMLRWRRFLAWMAAGAVLAGAVSYVRRDQTPEAVQTGGQKAGQELTDDLSDLKERLTDAQLQNVKYVMDYEAFYRDRTDYQKKSLLMKLDANCVQKTDLTFYVDAADWRMAAGIEKAYEDLIQGRELGVYAAGQIHGESVSGISEAVSLARGSGNLDEGTNSFRVSIMHYDKTVMRDIVKAVIHFLEEKHDRIEEVMGKHGIVTVNRSESATADMGVLDRQKSVIDEIATMETTILQYKDAFTAEEQQYYDAMTEDASDSKAADGQEPDEEDRGALTGIRIRDVVLGMLLAAFLYGFVFFMHYVFNNKLCASDSLQELYGMPQLGFIPRQEEGGKPFAFIDQWILSLRDSGGRRFTREEAMRLSVAAVRMAAVREGTGRMILAGCGLCGQALEICKMIQEDLAKEGIQAEVLDNILYDAQAMCSLEGADAAVLVACAQSALYSEIGREMELLSRQGITILGGIVAA